MFPVFASLLLAAVMASAARRQTGTTGPQAPPGPKRHTQPGKARHNAKLIDWLRVTEWGSRTASGATSYITHSKRHPA